MYLLHANVSHLQTGGRGALHNAMQSVCGFKEKIIESFVETGQIGCQSETWAFEAGFHPEQEIFHKIKAKFKHFMRIKVGTRWQIATKRLNSIAVIIGLAALLLSDLLLHPLHPTLIKCCELHLAIYFFSATKFQFFLVAENFSHHSFTATDFLLVWDFFSFSSAK